MLGVRSKEQTCSCRFIIYYLLLGPEGFPCLRRFPQGNVVLSPRQDNQADDLTTCACADDSSDLVAHSRLTMVRHRRRSRCWLVAFGGTLACCAVSAMDPLPQQVEHPFRNLAAWLREVGLQREVYCCRPCCIAAGVVPMVFSHYTAVVLAVLTGRIDSVRQQSVQSSAVVWHDTYAYVS